MLASLLILPALVSTPTPDPEFRDPVAEKTAMDWAHARKWRPFAVICTALTDKNGRHACAFIQNGEIHPYMCKRERPRKQAELTCLSTDPAMRAEQERKARKRKYWRENMEAATALNGDRYRYHTTDVDCRSDHGSIVCIVESVGLHQGRFQCLRTSSLEYSCTQI